jgi:hypothetical protein
LECWFWIEIRLTSNKLEGRLLTVIHPLFALYSLEIPSASPNTTPYSHSA